MYAINRRRTADIATIHSPSLPAAVDHFFKVQRKLHKLFRGMMFKIDIVYGLCVIFRIVQQFVIEREIPGAGSLSDIQIREVALRSLDTLNAMEPRLQWLHSYATEEKVYCV
jgi:hypothetical protein